MNFNFENTKASQITFYDLLGCSRTSSIEQINTEFKMRALKCHPDKIENSEKCDEFKRLLEAKETLNNCREKYDLWIDSGMCVSWPEWIRFTEKNKIVFHWHSSKMDPMLTNNNENTTSNKSAIVNVLDNFRNEESDNEILLKFRKNMI